MTAAWTDVTMTIDGVDYPVPVLEVAPKREPAEAFPGLTMVVEMTGTMVWDDVGAETFRLAAIRINGRRRGARRAARRRQRGREAAFRCRQTKHLHRLGWRPEAAVESERLRMRRDEATTEFALAYMHRVCR